MKKVVVGALAVALTVLVGGCGSEVDKVTGEMMQITEQIADITSGLKDMAAFEAARPRIQELAGQLEATIKKNKSLKGTKSSIEAAKKKYQPRAEAAQRKMESAPADVRAAVQQIVAEAMTRGLQ